MHHSTSGPLLVENFTSSWGWIADIRDERIKKKEIRNLVSLDYWFVSGIYAEILHVEKCFLTEISPFSLFSHSPTTVADRFFSTLCNNSIL